MGAPGFDDAPLVTPPRRVHGERKRVQFVYPYYQNPNFLARQVALWLDYPTELQRHLSVIIVDDGSPDAPARDVLGNRELPFSLRLFRIEVDVRWNWLAARNIAMHHAADTWCVLTDMDHMIPAATLDRLTACVHDTKVIYRLSRREGSGVAIHPHPNSMFMTRDMFWRVGGYDELLSGCYGTDGEWRRRCAATAQVLTLTDELLRYEHDGDSSTVRYKRKQPEDARKKKIIAARGRDWRPLHLSFPYHEVTL